jgi:hypothetical protein
MRTSESVTQQRPAARAVGSGWSDCRNCWICRHPSKHTLWPPSFPLPPQRRDQRPIGCHFEYGSSIVRAAARSGSVEIS